jgi:CheY-like chemotaxis protein
MHCKCILVVDDEANIREVVSACLHKLGGWQILTAASGQEGLNLAQTEQPDAILLDVMMPEMDGMMVLKRLCAHPDTHGIPVILLTATSPLIADRGKWPPGVAAAIAKPFSPVALVDQIATTLHWNLEPVHC